MRDKKNCCFAAKHLLRDKYGSTVRDEGPIHSSDSPSPSHFYVHTFLHPKMTQKSHPPFLNSAFASLLCCPVCGLFTSNVMSCNLIISFPWKLLSSLVVPPPKGSNPVWVTVSALEDHFQTTATSVCSYKDFWNCLVLSSWVFSGMVASW